jgi:hypothetical protein
VRVWPAHQPERAERGRVLIMSSNLCSAAVSFEGLPLFLAREVRTRDDAKFAIDRTTGGIVMLLTRDQPSGPWRDVGVGGRFEMEAVTI